MKTLLVYSELSGFAIQIKNHIFDALQELNIEAKECYIDDVDHVSREFQPTMHIFTHHQTKLYEYLPVIKNLKGHKLLWTHEDPWESDITFDMLNTFYYIFTTDENTAEALKKESTSNQIFYVPHACNPKVHKKVEVPYEYRSDILFIGNSYKSRFNYFQEHAQAYKDKLVTLIGVGYRGLEGYNNQRVIHGHISESEMVKYINGAKTVLNLHRMTGDLDMRNKRNIQPKHLNNRFYKLQAMGANQVVIGRDNMDEEIKKIDSQKPEDYSYVARIRDYYMPLLK